MSETALLVLATRNLGKIREMREAFSSVGREVISIDDALRSAGLDPATVSEPVEDAETFEANASIKARAYALACGHPVLADDSGLEVDALGGAPGVHSARYAGDGCTDADNNAKLLRALEGVEDRSARFRCALAFATADGDVEHIAFGECDGVIRQTAIGELGFGYDPLFVPRGESRSMAQLEAEEKRAISHRGAAIAAMLAWFRAR